MRLLGGLLLAGTSEALKCQVCSEWKDTNLEITGTGNRGCFDLDQEENKTKYEQECPPEANVCQTESIADWVARGEHLYSIKRSCAVKKDERACDTGTGAANFRDCVVQCEGDNCNNDNTEIFKKTTADTKVSSCNICSYQQKPDGSVEGIPECGNTIGDNKIQKECPPYADAACFDAASYHKFHGAADGEDATFEDFYRGCTPFILKKSENQDTSWDACQTNEVNGISQYSCKQTCNKPNCNKENHQVTSQCYSCKGTRDGADRKYGTSDDRCWNNLREDMIIDCEVDEVCVDELQIEWLRNGHYLRTIERGCRPRPQDNQPTKCDSLQVDKHLQIQECRQYCEGLACNNDLSVGDLFSTKNETTEPQMCQQCAYLEFDDGHREGVPACMNSADPNRLVECPSFADHGCYTATQSHIYNGREIVQVERGCATFGVENGVKPGLDCYDAEDKLNESQQIAVCKDYCLANNCNNQQPTFNDASGGIWPACVTCEVRFNDNDETIGVGNGLDCRGYPGVLGEYEMSKEAVAKFLRRCPNKGDYCMTDMQADWLPRGDIEFEIKRGCSTEPEREKCYSGSSTLVQYRDCQHGCSPLIDGNGCNDDLEQISYRLNDGRLNVKECVKCSYWSNADGSVSGNENCPLVPDLSEEDRKAMTSDCPPYAKVACGSARSFHTAYNGVENELFKFDDFRHCSPFDAFPEVDCAFETINALEHVNCKHSCTDNACNIIDIQRGNKCYACTATVDSNGRNIGVGDTTCFNLEDNPLTDNMMIDCVPGEEYCATEILADWEPKGSQVFRLIRGCAAKAAEDSCKVQGNQYFKYKDCQESCENKDGACNNQNTIYEKISEDKVTKCHQCYYEEKDNGYVQGNLKCNSTEALTDFSEACPPFATQACFSSASKHFDYGREFKQLYKGCSAFELVETEIDNISLPDDTGHISQYAFTKKTCDKDDCNVDHEEPQTEGDAAATWCQACSVVVDQFNKTVGVGNKDCWEGTNPSFQTKCENGQFCSTELEIDWLPRGQHQFRLVRGCTRDPPSYDAPCEEGGSRNGKYKDCKVSCDPRQDGNSCNTGLDSVSKKFVGRVEIETCMACEYYENLDGSVTGNKKCNAFQLEGGNFAGAMVCPQYAQSSCYTATSYHVDYSGDGVNGDTFEDYFRGCSPFSEHNGNTFGKHCERTTLDGYEHENCKELCFGPNCNFEASATRPMCHVCSVTIDSEGNTVGSSDPQCLVDLTDSSANVQECPPNQPYCTDIMEIDWYGRGMQYVHFNRGCTKEKSEGTCVDLTDIIGGTLKAKTCISESCENTNGPCNKDLKVTENFLPSSNGVKTCTACSYKENDDGTVSGNKNCGENASDMSVECPAWQSTACYVGSAKHSDTSGEKYETYKGCSYFETAKEVADDIIGGVAYSTVKETCKSDNCNEKLYNKP